MEVDPEELESVDFEADLEAKELGPLGFRLLDELEYLLSQFSWAISVF